MPNKSKFEREIDEILEKSENGPESPVPKKRNFEPFSPTVSRRVPPRHPLPSSINPGNLVIVGVLILTVAAFVPTGTLPLAIVGFAIGAAGYVLWFRTGGRGPNVAGWRGRSSGSSGAQDKAEPEVKYWRGRRIEEKPTPRRSKSANREKGKIIEFGPPVDDQNTDKK
ncbi:MAG: hypothetical protein O3B95_01625 [Chloroflexi bacterium]|nr:hypothetical protein [Chloroflexota bacterium]